MIRPSDDIDLPNRTFFEFTRDGETVGWGGFETHGADGLLRSLVVEPAYRSKGVGAEVLRVIEAIAAKQGIARFHLLTTTASGFFEQQGYALNQRGSAPPLISQTGRSGGFALARLATCARRYHSSKADSLPNRQPERPDRKKVAVRLGTQDHESYSFWDGAPPTR
ncbi:GNAT family N-acetyltransferase [Pseudomonas rhizophila]|uniref:GNAT family N-acetyltransferase n=1 Tax=Pseudomonas rhizophila TaxID=2045200 RepID=UPI0030D78494